MSAPNVICSVINESNKNNTKSSNSSSGSSSGGGGSDSGSSSSSSGSSISSSSISSSNGSSSSSISSSSRSSSGCVNTILYPLINVFISARKRASCVIKRTELEKLRNEVLAVCAALNLWINLEWQHQTADSEAC